MGKKDGVLTNIDEELDKRMDEYKNYFSSQIEDVERMLRTHKKNKREVYAEWEKYKNIPDMDFLNKQLIDE